MKITRKMELEEYINTHAEFLRPWIRYCLRAEVAAAIRAERKRKK